MAQPDAGRSVWEQLSAREDVRCEIQQRLGHLPAKKKALRLSWGEGYSDAELAQRFGYGSAAVVKTTRLRCLRQVRQACSGRLIKST